MTSSVGVCCYADPGGMRRLLETTLSFDYVICIVGKWKDFEYDNEKNIEMISVISSYPNTLIKQIDGIPQHQARNIYLYMAEKLGCDYLIILDSDEYLSGGVFNVPKEQNIYNMKWNNTVLPRLIVKPKGMEYKDRHNQIWCDEKEMIGRNLGECIEGIEIISDKSLREKEREDYQREYNLSHPNQ